MEFLLPFKYYVAIGKLAIHVYLHWYDCTYTAKPAYKGH
jgi:hypothetical protein